MILKQYVDQMRDYYDYILIDCMPSLGMLTINAFAACDSAVSYTHLEVQKINFKEESGVKIIERFILND